MSDFKAKMHQIQLSLRLHPRPCWQSLQHSPDLLAGFKGPTLGYEVEGEGSKWEGNEEAGPPCLKILKNTLIAELIWLAGAAIQTFASGGNHPCAATDPIMFSPSPFPPPPGKPKFMFYMFSWQIAAGVEFKSHKVAQYYAIQ